MSLADLHQHQAVALAMDLSDQPLITCAVLVRRGRTETFCARKPACKEWSEVLVHGDTDIIVYDVCTFHYRRHLEGGVINSLGKLIR